MFSNNVSKKLIIFSPIALLLAAFITEYRDLFRSIFSSKIISIKIFKENNILILDNIDDDKIALCTIIRRFITRYLSGKSGENIIKNNKKLKQNLLVGEFYPNKFILIEEKLNKMFGDIDVDVSQAYKLYEYLGGDENDKNKLNEIINKNKEEEDVSEREKEEDKSEDENNFENDEEENNSDDEEHDFNDTEEENEENNDNSVEY